MMDYSNALDPHLKALNKFQLANNKQAILGVLHNLSEILSSLKEDETTLHYLFKNLELAEELSNKKEEVYACYKIGSFFKRRQQFEHAIKYWPTCGLVVSVKIVGFRDLGGSRKNLKIHLVNNYLYENKNNRQKPNKINNLKNN